MGEQKPWRSRLRREGEGCLDDGALARWMLGGIKRAGENEIDGG